MAKLTIRTLNRNLIALTPSTAREAVLDNHNPPSLLGLQVGGPFFHGGNARTLEEVLDARFSGHHQSAIAPAFTVDATKIRQLVAFLMSIDESSAPIAIPALGATGGDLCHYP